MKPFSREFNAAVFAMANRVCPAGYDIAARQFQLRARDTCRLSRDAGSRERRLSLKTIGTLERYSWRSSRQRPCWKPEEPTMRPMIQVLSHNAIARTESVRESVAIPANISRGCDNCGCFECRMYRYGTRKDDSLAGRVAWRKGIFCSKGCCNSYHGV